MKKIGIIGSGVVGKTLASGFLKHGYEVTIGTRDPQKLAEWQAKEPKGKVASFEETARFGDIIVLATKGNGASNALTLAGAANLKGKTIIDTTNPIDETRPPVNGVLNFFTREKSLLELLQEQVPDAHFVKAFNSIGAHGMVNPQFAGGKPTMFICGNNENARKEVTAILDQFGFETEDVGASNAAGSIESLCILWCIPGFLQNRWMHAFKLLK